MTYQLLQQKLKDYREQGIELECKLNARKEVLENEVIRIEQFTPTEDQNVITKIPFEGFYASHYSLDDIELTHYNEDGCFYDDCEEFTVNEYEYVWDNWDVSDYEKQVSEAYVESFNIHLFDLLVSSDNPALDDIYDQLNGVKLFTFEKLTSPQYYNFSTDRIFAYMNKDLVLALKNYAFNHDQFPAYLEDNFKSCPGFISHYSYHLTDWIEEFPNWDHNQYGALIDFFIKTEDIHNEIRFNIYEDLSTDGLLDPTNYMESSTVNYLYSGLIRVKDSLCEINQDFFEDITIKIVNNISDYIGLYDHLDQPLGYYKLKEFKEVINMIEPNSENVNEIMGYLLMSEVPFNELAFTNFE